MTGSRSGFGSLHMRRSRGAVSGLLLIILGVWGALIPFIGPYFHFAYTPGQPWAWSTARAWLEVFPGATTVVGGFLLLVLYLFTLSSLLAASLIDLELFVIPLEIPYFLALVALIIHALADRPTVPGALNLSPPLAALSAGAFGGLVVSVVLFLLRILPASFAEGEPMLEVDKEKSAQETDLPPEYSAKRLA